MFTVFGATGNTGKVVAQRLLAAGKKVRVAVRDPKKVEALAKAGAEVVTVDVLDPASVAKALDGAEGAYLLLPPDPTSTDFVARAHKIIAGYEAVAAKVPHVVMLSSIGAELPGGTGPIYTAHLLEQALQKAGAKATFVRAAYFMENLLNYAHPMKADGVLPVFGGGEAYPFPMIATEDIGDVSANALLNPPAQTEIVELSGPADYSFNDAAAAATKILGREVKATPVPIEALVPALTGLGMSNDVARLYREMTEAFGKGTVRFQNAGRTVRGKRDLESVLRPALT